MWTNENRARYDRSHLRYPSDLSDDEWKLVEPLIPPGKRGGDKRTVIMREVVNGLMYILIELMLYQDRACHPNSTGRNNRTTSSAATALSDGPPLTTGGENIHEAVHNLAHDHCAFVAAALAWRINGSTSFHSSSLRSLG